MDVKGDVIAAPPDGYSFEYDSTLNAVRSTAPGTAAAKALVSGNWETFPTGKIALFMTAGYLRQSDTGFATLRTSIGDANLGVLGGYGMSDSPTGNLASGHVLLIDRVGSTKSGSYIFADSQSLLEAIQAAIGASGYFLRYSIYRPDGLFMESKVLDGTTGAVLAGTTNDVAYPDATVPAVLPDIAFDAKFRMHGYKSTGIWMFHFDTLPSDYLLAMITMAKEAKDGNRFVWPYWT